MTDIAVIFIKFFIEFFFGYATEFLFSVWFFFLPSQRQHLLIFHTWLFLLCDLLDLYKNSTESLLLCRNHVFLLPNDSGWIKNNHTLHIYFWRERFCWNDVKVVTLVKVITYYNFFLIATGIVLRFLVVKESFWFLFLIKLSILLLVLDIVVTIVNDTTHFLKWLKFRLMETTNAKVVTIICWCYSL